MNKIILLFPIFIFLNVNIAFADNSACSYFCPKLSELPYMNLVRFAHNWNNGTME